MFDELVKFFVVLLVVVEPLSLLPVLAGLTEGADDAYRRRMAVKAIGISAAVCLVFAAGGSALLGISVHAFKVGGGILLFLLAIEMVFARPSGVPPASLQFVLQVGVIVLVLVITLALMLVTGPVMRIVGVTGAAVLGRLLGVLLAALAVQFVMDGVRGATAA